MKLPTHSLDRGFLSLVFAGSCLLSAFAQQNPTLAINAGGTISWSNSPTNAILTLETSRDVVNGPWTALFSLTGTNAGGTSNILLRTPASFFRMKLTPAPKVLPEMILIHEGVFQMGDTYNAAFTKADERPAHNVFLSGYYIDRFEVTNEKMRQVLQWAFDKGKVEIKQGTVAPYVGNKEGNLRALVVLKGPPSSTSTRDFQITFSNGKFSVDSGREDYPVVGVTWYGALAYGNYLSDMYDLPRCTDLTNWTCDITKSGFRPPTEAEWEKAARGGLVANHYPWPSAGTPTVNTNMANYTPVGLPHSVFNTKPVGYYNGTNNAPAPNMANGYGLYDVAGNVREWCLDWYDSTWYSQPAAAGDNPVGPPAGTHRVVRGGSWDWDQGLMRCSARDHQAPNETYWYNGFRIVRRQN